MNLSEEKVLMPGHTLSLLQWGGELYGYLGGVGFDGIKLYSGFDIENLKFKQELFYKRRWCTCAEYQGKIHLYCTENIGDDGKYDKQLIHHYTGDNPWNMVEEPEKILGSAPFPAVMLNDLFLYYHVKTGDTDKILCSDGDETKIILESHPRVTLSAPSIFYNMADDNFRLTAEMRSGDEPWYTILCEASEPDELFIWKKILLNDWRACAFQYSIDGKYHLVYSRMLNDKWEICYKYDTDQLR